MNYIILGLTGNLSQTTISIIKLFLSSSIGFIIMRYNFFSRLKVFYTLIFKICLSIIIIVEHLPEKFRNFIRTIE
jgi:hypothetical protein